MIQVGIEMSRELRLNAKGLVPAGTLAAGGVNLLRHALTLARKLTEPQFIRVLTIEPDETVLQLVGEFDCREGGVLQWVAELADAAPNAADGDAVIILRQTAPLKDERPIQQALAMLKKHRCAVSAARGQQNRVFEVWRLNEFGRYGFGGPDADPPQVELPEESFVEINRAEDFERAGAMLSAKPKPGTK